MARNLTPSSYGVGQRKSVQLGSCEPLFGFISQDKQSSIYSNNHFNYSQNSMYSRICRQEYVDEDEQNKFQDVQIGGQIYRVRIKNQRKKKKKQNSLSYTQKRYHILKNRQKKQKQYIRKNSSSQIDSDHEQSRRQNSLLSSVTLNNSAQQYRYIPHLPKQPKPKISLPPYLQRIRNQLKDKYKQVFESQSSSNSDSGDQVIQDKQVQIVSHKKITQNDRWGSKDDYQRFKKMKEFQQNKQKQLKLKKINQQKLQKFMLKNHQMNRIKSINQINTNMQKNINFQKYSNQKQINEQQNKQKLKVNQKIIENRQMKHIQLNQIKLNQIKKLSYNKEQIKTNFNVLQVDCDIKICMNKQKNVNKKDKINFNCINCQDLSQDNRYNNNKNQKNINIQKQFIQQLSDSQNNECQFINAKKIIQLQ